MASIATNDAELMRRCLDLSKISGEQGEYPYAAVIGHNGQFLCESVNRVARDRDVTRHAEVVALSAAQTALGQTSLEDCTIYVIAEPCAFCSYAIRETRIGRVVYGLKSPVMGGHSRWDIMADPGLSHSMPEVFAPPPEIVAGYMEDEAEEILQKWRPLMSQVIKHRGLFIHHSGADKVVHSRPRHDGIWQRIMSGLRRMLFDRIGRS